MTIAWNNPWSQEAGPFGRPHRGRGGHREHPHDEIAMHNESERPHRGGRGGRGGRNRRHHTGDQWPGQWPPPPVGPPPPPMPPNGGPWGGFGPPPGPHSGAFTTGRKARRGDVRAAILALLAEEPLNGYQIMQTIQERSQGAWRPSPGAVYPALQQLTDEALIEPVGEGRRTRYELTEAGTTYIAEHGDEVDAPWEAMTPQVDKEAWDIMELSRQSSTALMQVLQSGRPSQLAKAKKILENSRRSFYQILADGDDEAVDQDGEDQDGEDRV